MKSFRSFIMLFLILTTGLSFRVTDDMPFKKEGLTVKILEIQCIDPTDSDGEDELKVEVTIDGKRVRVTDSESKLGPWRLKKGKVLRLNETYEVKNHIVIKLIEEDSSNADDKIGELEFWESEDNKYGEKTKQFGPSSCNCIYDIKYVLTRN